jgi:predicted dehydrogenase
MNKRLTVGIVGFGGAGLAHYKHFSSIEEVKVKSVYDPNEEGLNRATTISKDLFITNSFNAFLQSDIDIVSICSPDKTHADYIIRSLEAGKHTLCEKPLTDSLDGCKRILLAEKKSSGCVAAVLHQMRFLPAHLKMKQIIKNGGLGRLCYIEGYYVHNLTERAVLYDKWRFEDRATPLVYSGCHFVDLLRWLLDEEAVDVVAMANNIAFPQYPESDLNVVLFQFGSGVVGKVVTAFGAGRPQDHSVRIYGSEKSIENNLLFSGNGKFSVFHRPFLQLSSAKRLSLMAKMNHIRRYIRPVVFSLLFEMLMSLYRQYGEYSLSSYPMRVYEHEWAVSQSISDFIQSIRTGQKPKCSLTDSAKTVATCLAGVEAYRTGNSVSVRKYWIPEFNEAVNDV